MSGIKIPTKDQLNQNSTNKSETTNSGTSTQESSLESRKAVRAEVDALNGESKDDFASYEEEGFMDMLEDDLSGEIDEVVEEFDPPKQTPPKKKPEEKKSPEVSKKEEVDDEIETPDTPSEDVSKQAKAPEDTSEEVEEESTQSQQFNVDTDAIAQVFAKLKASLPQQQDSMQQQTPVGDKPVTPETQQQTSGQQAPEQSPASSPEQQKSEEYQQVYKKAEEQLITSFAMSEEEEETFRDNPGQILPKMLARLYLDVFNAITTGVNKALPQTVSQVVKQESQQQEIANQFYTVWPQLREHSAIVDRLSETYAKHNKGFSMMQAIMEVGAQAWISAKLPLDGLQQHIGVLEQFTTTGKAPKAQPKTSTTKDPSKRVPPGMGKASGSQTNKGQVSAFDEFVEEVYLSDMT